MSSKKIVMKDVARAANVHQTTVSLALNNDPRIAEATRVKIQEIARKLGYVPDPVLSSLVSYRRSTRKPRADEVIALVFDIPDPDHFEKSSYLSTIKEVCVKRGNALGYKVEVFIKGLDFTGSAMLDRVLKSRGIQGVLLGAIYDVATRIDLDWPHYAAVKIGSNPMELEVDTVMANYFYASRKIMRKLKEAGYRRPAMAGSIRDERNTRNAYAAGFLYGQHKHFSQEHYLDYFEFEPVSNEEIQDNVFWWLCKTKPDVLISYWNNLIHPVLRLYREHGHVCRFISAAADEDTIRFGGIRNNYTKMSETAVNVLVGKLRMHERGISDNPTLTLIESTWHELTPWHPSEAEILYSERD